MIDFGTAQAELAKVDFDRADDEKPRAFKLQGFENKAMKNGST